MMRTMRTSEVLLLVAVAGFAAALVLGLFPAQGEAVVNCATAGTADADSDGLSDLVECSGIGGAAPAFSFAAGLTFGGGTSLPTCAVGIARADCLDPNTKDFFVVIARAGTTRCDATTPPATSSCTWIPANPTQFISQSLSAGGLAITVHELAEGAVTGGDLLVLASGSTQHYLKVNESLAPATADDDDLGRGNVGTPNSSFAFATVFTQRIHDYHASVYQNAGDTTIPAGEVDRYVLHTVAHEISHNLDLCACSANARYGGRHYKTGTNVVMEQSVKVTVQGPNVTFFISEDYPSQDQTGAHLAP